VGKNERIRVLESLAVVACRGRDATEGRRRLTLIFPRT
jgi:hypothetical protein